LKKVCKKFGGKGKFTTFAIPNETRAQVSSRPGFRRERSLKRLIRKVQGSKYLKNKENESVDSFKKDERRRRDTENYKLCIQRRV
jgi:hypothetical protein